MLFDIYYIFRYLIWPSAWHFFWHSVSILTQHSICLLSDIYFGNVSAAHLAISLTWWLPCYLTHLTCILTFLLAFHFGNLSAILRRHRVRVRARTRHVFFNIWRSSPGRQGTRVTWSIPTRLDKARMIVNLHPKILLLAVGASRRESMSTALVTGSPHVGSSTTWRYGLRSGDHIAQGQSTLC